MNRLALLVGVGMSGWVWTSAASGAGERMSPDSQWPAWRGPRATGAAPKANPPIEWSETKNVRWKAAIPGKGHASPIVWGDRVYIQTAVEIQQDPPKSTADTRPIGAGAVERGSAEPTWAVVQPEPGDGDRPRRGPRGRGPGGPGGRFGPGPKPVHAFKFDVLAIDRKTGKVAWTTTVREQVPHEGGHPTSSQASSSPVTDGRRLYAYFGSRGLYALTLDGKIDWRVDLGQMHTRNEFGEGSSPALFGDTLVVNWDHEGDDFIVAFDKRTGTERWRVARDEPTSWSTPLVVQAGGKPQVVVTATNYTRAYDLATGREVWRCKGMTNNVIPSPLAGGDLLYAISGFRGAALLAIRYARARGDITGTPAIAWTYDRDTPYVPSGVLTGGRLYFLDNNRPVVTCLDAKTGKALYARQRLKGIDDAYSSLVAAGGRVYVVGRNGTTVVLRDGPKFEVLATNSLDDGFDASPAVASGDLLLRGEKHLYCLASRR